MIKPCKRCGTLFQAVGNMKYCVDCRPFVRHEYSCWYRKVNRDKIREYDRQCRERDRERYNASHREYYHRQKLKLIREILSAEAVNRDD